MRRPVCLLLLVVTACTSSQVDAVGSCEPSLTSLDPLIGAEVEADGPGDIEGWALVFAHWNVAPGDPVTIQIGEEIKIVWRLTGEGEVSFRALGPDGEVEGISWGPDPHGRSNWTRPGDEWGTGWVLPSGGCWTLEASRGEDVWSIAAEVS